MSSQPLQLLAPLLNNAAAVFTITELDEQLIAANLARAQVAIAHQPSPPKPVVSITTVGNDDDDDSDFELDDDNDASPRRQSRRVSKPPVRLGAMTALAAPAAPAPDTVAPATPTLESTMIRTTPTNKVARPRKTIIPFTTHEAAAVDVSRQP